MVEFVNSLNSTIKACVEKSITNQVDNPGDTSCFCINGAKYHLPKALSEHAQDNLGKASLIDMLSHSEKLSAFFIIRCLSANEIKNCQLFFFLSVYCDKLGLTDIVSTQKPWVDLDATIALKKKVLIPDFLVLAICRMAKEEQASFLNLFSSEVRIQTRRRSGRLSNRKANLIARDALIYIYLHLVGKKA